MGEIGSTGLNISAGRVQEEFLPKLKGPRAAKTFREMSENDPVVGAILFAIDMVLREVAWHANPREADCAECQRWADFLGECLGDMSQTWPQTVSSILTFLPFGWSFHEICYKKRDGETGQFESQYSDGLIGWRKLALRVQESLYEWKFDETGGLQAMRQSTQNDPIPVEKALLFRTTTARSNPEGRSVLRNAYRPWYFKKRIEEIEAIGVERDLAGLPVAKIPLRFLLPSASTEEKATLAEVQKIVRSIRRDEQEGIVWPTDRDENGNDEWTLELLSTGGQRQLDTNEIIGRYDQRIAMVVLGDLILLGHENVGSKALGVSKLELFLVALTAYLDEVGSVFNRHGIPRLMRYNGVLPEHYPVLGHDEIAEEDLVELAKLLDAFVGAGGIMDEALEAHVRRKAGWPEREAEPSEV
jgi:hypothetical protein